MSWKCPKCGSDSLKVVVLMQAFLHQEEDGNIETEVFGDQEWDGESNMTCRDCGTWGEARLFEEKRHGG